MKHNEKVCRAHDLGSYAQGQGRSQVKGQNLVSAITQKLLKQMGWSGGAMVLGYFPVPGRPTIL